ncbi:MAG: hydrogenase formation protein HypD [Anaerovoracaceae bacterium]
MNAQDLIERLRAYDGPPLKLMEVCGTHTAAIFRNGIRSLISPRIELISGPGCPVCVTPAAYIDRVIAYAEKPDHTVLSFGDMMKVPGSSGSLSEHRGRGASVEIMYSPFEALDKAAAHPEHTYVVAAVGFETTAPAYALLVRQAAARGIENLRLVTALKTMPPALDWLCASQPEIDGFLCPGHVCVIIGSRAFAPLAEKYHKPCAVAGFEAEHILAAIYDLVQQIKNGEARVDNLYRNAVEEEGNRKAQAAMRECYQSGPAMWRGLGIIEGSGLYLSETYRRWDGGSRGLSEDAELPPECACAEVITGRRHPDQCRLFGSGCTPLHPYGPCMVSAEGACGIWYRNR